jgi:MFS family permease
MPTGKQTTGISRRPIKHLRWWIGGLLFASTVINYIDRQTFSVLGPYLKIEYHWNNEQFAIIVISFRIAYSIGQTISGRLIDRIGTRKGLTITVIWYSIAAMLTSFSMGLRSFAFFRFLLGAGESANWPAAMNAGGPWHSSIAAHQLEERSLRYSSLVYTSISEAGDPLSSLPVLSDFYGLSHGAGSTTHQKNIPASVRMNEE